MNQALATSCLFGIKKVFDSLNIKFYPKYGTLLGMIREQNFIKGDNDIDLTMFATDWCSDLPEWLKLIGYKHCFTTFKGKIPVQVSLIRGKIRADIGLLYYYPPENTYVKLNKRLYDKWNCIPAIHFQGEHFIDFLGRKFRIYNKSEILLENWYGPDWRIPTPRMTHSQHKLATQVNRNRGKRINLQEYMRYINDNSI